MNSITIFEHLYGAKERKIKEKEYEEKRKFISFCLGNYKKFKQGGLEIKEFYKECKEKYPDVNTLLVTATFYQLREYDKNIEVPETSRYLIDNYLRDLKNSSSFSSSFSRISSEDLLMLEEDISQNIPECYKEATLEEFRREIFSTSI